MECISEEMKKTVPLEWEDEKCQCPLLAVEVLVPWEHNQYLAKGYCSQEENGTECYEKVRRLKITKDKKERKTNIYFCSYLNVICRF